MCSTTDLLKRLACSSQRTRRTKHFSHACMCRAVLLIEMDRWFNPIIFFLQKYIIDLSSLRVCKIRGIRGKTFQVYSVRRLLERKNVLLHKVTAVSKKLLISKQTRFFEALPECTEKRVQESLIATSANYFLGIKYACCFLQKSGTKPFSKLHMFLPAKKSK